MSALSQSLPPPKQIRFVNNPGQPPSKRRRINAACLTCRKRKTRCAGERPVCSTCTKNGHECLGYSDIVERKKEQNGSAASGSGLATTESTHHGRSAEADPKSDYDELDDVDDEFGEEPDTSSSQNSKAGIAVSPRRRASEVGQRNTAAISNASPLRRRRASGNDLSHDRPRHSEPHECDVGQQSQQKHRQAEQLREGHQTSNAQRADYRRSVSFQGSSHGSHGSHGGHGSSKRSPSLHQLPPQHPSQHPSQHHNESHRVPYFRYFGPTAIVPGYKQMVVDVSSRDRRRSRGSSFSTSSPNATLTEKNLSYFRSQQHRQSRGSFDTPFETLEELPIYDPNDTGPIHPIIINLVKTFFLHLGCNYPFLREQRVLLHLRNKRMEPILVDAMCALAARFSDLPIFTNGNDDGQEGDSRMSRSEYGSFYAQRAKAATVDTFPCPSVAAVQACLLMAYEGFGADQDSALWMYLGIAIRMAVDLGLQKKISVDTTQAESDPLFIRSWKGNGSGGDQNSESTSKPRNDGRHDDQGNGQGMDMAAADNTGRRGIDSFGAEEIRADEQERADTFWAVFFLDRVISSGTGRPVTFRDDDFDLAFPEAVLDPVTKRPAPFPILAQIIHLYGRVSDVLNNIRSVDDLTEEKMKRLGQMESDLTQLYQRQDPRLNFNAPNFQAYVRAGQGSTFILLHFWIHALIIILHQPTLLTPFGSLHRRRQLLPNSHELSMSSAKTIADILAFAELIDPKSFIGNPFTSQPMYIAACAFLTESIANASMPTSRNASPPHASSLAQAREETATSGGTGSSGNGNIDARTAAKHSLLASNANQNYQRCYKSLQQLHLYWGGVRYILSALDQKSKGIWDCETFTLDEMDTTRNNHKQSLSHIPVFDSPGSPNAPPIAWSLTGTSNSANPSLTVLFQSHANAAGHAQASSQPRPKQTQRSQKQHRQHQQEQHQPTARQQPDQSPRSAATPPGNMVYDPIRQSLPEAVPSIYPATAFPQATLSAIRYSPQISSQQPQLPNQQPQYHQHGAAYPGSAMQGQATQAYKNDQIRHGIIDDASPGVVLDGQQAGMYGSSDAAYHAQHVHQQQQLHHGYVQHQQGDMAQGQLRQAVPAPLQSFSTPSSHQSSYEGGINLPATSPTSNSLSDFGQAQVRAAAAAASLGHLDGRGLHPPPPRPLQPTGFGAGDGSGGDGGYVGDPYSYLETGPLPDVITFDSQEVDISQVPLLTDIMPQWLEYLPSNVLNLFDENFSSTN
ncbi:pathway-specific nitrogen regulator [Ophiostoma piceae UAMH 11346]|uniref:Pathway-specific nitrogen regulator n=1 Tax=Ophiostoma piceae (strain UAMH 11346) TaxID=1262450 RepID=S3C2M4_OPHP1|nr:pathway-specific nitrogen regulator [Ophiostoma piceae UAMH 11346]